MIARVRSVGRWFLMVCAWCAAAGVTALIVAFLFVIGGFRGNAQLPADCALVFGAAVYGYAQPSPAIVRRVDTAARLYREGMVKTVIVSGGIGRGGGTSLSEATVMRAQAIRGGVVGTDILVEGESHSTLENLTFSRPLVDSCQSVVGVSDEYHLARIRLLARRQGWENFTVLPSDERPALPSEVHSVIREMFGMLYYGLSIDRILTI